MDTYVIVLITAGVVALLALAIVFLRGNKTMKKSEEQIDPSTRQLKLQAYERLTLLVDRIALPNIISRLGQTHITAREMQMILTQNIKEEFDYNITQQIYVSPEAWGAVKNLKEQNLLIINQLSNTLPPNANGLDLNKLLLQYLMNNNKGALHEVVSEVLAFEAKKLL